MSELRVEKITMPAAVLSDTSNPLPQLKPLPAFPWPARTTGGIIGDDDKYFNYGCQTPLLPYLQQDNYDRKRKERSFKSIVLENEYLRAVFLPEVGGKLWSLYHKIAERELLYVNPVFQPANFAYRNAWTSGGIEWNMGMPAHNPFTSDNVFAATLKDDDCPVLRVYEWERIRNAPFQIDFYLPKGSPLLLARAKLFNPHDFEIPVYWYTNIAVPEEEGARFITPANYAYTFDYENRQHSMPVTGAAMPYYKGTDVSYPVNIPCANDYFYRIEVDKQWPWMTSLDKSGSGLFEASTRQLKSRKLFVWGMNPGGRRWQDFLTEPGNPYVEIQAGLGRTQVECMPISANSNIEWLECFGLVECDSEIVHGTDWAGACFEVESRIKKQVSCEWLEKELERTKAMSLTSPEEIVHTASGWGALEQKRMGYTVSPAIVFPESTLNNEQTVWLNLFETGKFNSASPADVPQSYLVGSEWKFLLEKAVVEGKADHWFGWYHLGLMRYVNQDKVGALKAWKESVENSPSLWSYWAMAQYYYVEGEKELAIQMFEKAVSINKLPELLMAYCVILMEMHEIQKLAAVLKYCEDIDLISPRVQLAKAKYLCSKEDYDLSEAVLDDLELADLRESETSMTDVWFEIQAGRRAKLNGTSFDAELVYVKENLTPPRKIDFRMT